jgi:hypothetical protein
MSGERRKDQESLNFKPRKKPGLDGDSTFADAFGDRWASTFLRAVNTTGRAGAQLATKLLDPDEKEQRRQDRAKRKQAQRKRERVEQKLSAEKYIEQMGDKSRPGHLTNFIQGQLVNYGSVGTAVLSGRDPVSGCVATASRRPVFRRRLERKAEEGSFHPPETFFVMGIIGEAAKRRLVNTSKGILTRELDDDKLAANLNRLTEQIASNNVERSNQNEEQRALPYGVNIRELSRRQGMVEWLRELGSIISNISIFIMREFVQNNRTHEMSHFIMREFVQNNRTHEMSHQDSERLVKKFTHLLRFLEHKYYKYFNDYSLTDLIELIRDQLHCLFTRFENCNSDEGFQFQDVKDIPDLLDSLTEVLAEVSIPEAQVDLQAMDDMPPRAQRTLGTMHLGIPSKVLDRRPYRQRQERLTKVVQGLERRRSGKKRLEYLLSLINTEREEGRLARKLLRLVLEQSSPELQDATNTYKKVLDSIRTPGPGGKSATIRRAGEYSPDQEHDVLTATNRAFLELISLLPPRVLATSLNVPTLSSSAKQHTLWKKLDPGKRAVLRQAITGEFIEPKEQGVEADLLTIQVADESLPCGFGVLGALMQIDWTAHDQTLYHLTTSLSDHKEDFQDWLEQALSYWDSREEINEEVLIEFMLTCAASDTGEFLSDSPFFEPVIKRLTLHLFQLPDFSLLDTNKAKGEEQNADKEKDNDGDEERDDSSHTDKNLDQQYYRESHPDLAIKELKYLVERGGDRAARQIFDQLIDKIEAKIRVSSQGEIFVILQPAVIGLLSTIREHLSEGDYAHYNQRLSNVVDQVVSALGDSLEPALASWQNMQELDPCSQLALLLRQLVPQTTSTLSGKNYIEVGLDGRPNDEVSEQLLNQLQLPAHSVSSTNSAPRPVSDRDSSDLVPAQQAVVVGVVSQLLRKVYQIVDVRSQEEAISLSQAEQSERAGRAGDTLDLNRLDKDQSTAVLRSEHDQDKMQQRAQASYKAAENVKELRAHLIAWLRSLSDKLGLTYELILGKSDDLDSLQGVRFYPRPTLEEDPILDRIQQKLEISQKELTEILGSDELSPDLARLYTILFQEIARL